MIAPGFILGAKSPSQKGVQLQVASMSSNHFPKQFHQFALGAGKLPFFPGFVHLVTLPTQWLCHGKSLWSISISLSTTRLGTSSYGRRPRGFPLCEVPVQHPAYFSL